MSGSGIGERIMEHLRNTPPPQKQVTCIDCGAIFTITVRPPTFPYRRPPNRCPVCRNARTPYRVRVANAKRAAERAKAREGLVCQECGKPLNAKRSFACFCSSFCRLKAWRTGQG